MSLCFPVQHFPANPHKVAGSEDGVTAFQMDIKMGGITLPVMKQALLQAREGRKHILIEMSKCFPPPSKILSKYAPIIHVMKVKPDRVNLIIGSGGKKVKSIIEESGVESIDTQDNGIVKITAKDLSSLEKSKAIINNLTMVPSVGDVYRNCEIKSVAPYGVFVEFAPGREGLCHVSELSASWLAKPEDAFNVGDRIDVKLMEINEKGQLRLSRRALLPDPSPEKPRQPTAKESGDDKSPDEKVTVSSKSTQVEAKRFVGSGKAVSETDKTWPKRSSSKTVNNIPRKSKDAVVNGEAKIG